MRLYCGGRVVTRRQGGDGCQCGASHAKGDAGRSGVVRGCSCCCCCCCALRRSHDVAAAKATTSSLIFIRHHVTWMRHATCQFATIHAVNAPGVACAAPDQRGSRGGMGNPVARDTFHSASAVAALGTSCRIIHFESTLSAVNLSLLVLRLPASICFKASSSISRRLRATGDSCTSHTSNGAAIQIVTGLSTRASRLTLVMCCKSRVTVTDGNAFCG